MPKTNSVKTATTDKATTLPLIPGADEVPEELRGVLAEIVALTDRFCAERLGDEYQQLCREMAINLCVPGSPVKRGKRESWASGIVYAVGWVNFLSDPSQQPHLPSEEIAEGFGVSTSTMHNKAKEIREGLELIPFHPDYTLPSRLEDNPLVWMVMVNGFLMDVRGAPREIQESAYEQGLIPYVPGDSVVKLPQPGWRRTPSRPPEPKTDLVLQLKITLKHIQPPIWRRIQVRDCTLDTLHHYIQAAFGWEECHGHQFRIDGRYYGAPELLGDDEVVDSTMTLLSDIVAKKSKGFRFLYEYDFGDNWEHEILVEGFPQPESGTKYPICLDGRRAGPPEDVGGPWGYAEYLDALDDPRHERHEDFMEWSGPFDSETFDARKATKDMRRVE